MEREEWQTKHSSLEKRLKELTAQYETEKQELNTKYEQLQEQNRKQTEGNRYLYQSLLLSLC